MKEAQKMLRTVLMWLLQRITAVLLVVFLAIHIWTTNFATTWATMLRAGVDLSLLALALFHGLNGVRAVVLDFGIGHAARRVLSTSLVMIGFIAFLFGIYGLWPLLFP